MNKLKEQNTDRSVRLGGLLSADFDYELDSIPPEKGGETVCGKLVRKHKMKRYGSMHIGCIYPECDACQ